MRPVNTLALLLGCLLALPACARHGNPFIPGHPPGGYKPHLSRPEIRHAGVPLAPLHRPGHHLDHLPAGVATILVAGLTYYVLNDIFYRRAERGYVVVERPVETVRYLEQEMTTVDVDGQRYYLKAGRYYQRRIDGDYIEVPPPAALR